MEMQTDPDRKDSESGINKAGCDDQDSCNSGDREDIIYLSTESVTLTAPSMMHLGEQLYKERSQEKFCDYYLVVHGQKLSAHKCVLALTSPYFKTFFMSNFQDSVLNCVDVSHLFSTTQDLETVVKFMYTGEVTITRHNFQMIINAATYLLLDELTKLCCQYLDENLHPDNVFSFWELAEKYDLKSLIEKCESLVRNRFHDMLIHSKSTLKLGNSVLVQIIKRGLMCFTTFKAKLSFLINWTKYEQQERLPLLKEILVECHQEFGLDVQIIKTLHGDGVLRCLTRVMDNKSVETGDQLEKKLKEASTDVVVYYEKDDPGTVRVYAYLPKRREWVTLLWYYFEPPQYDLIRRFIGFAQNSAVFELKTRGQQPSVALIDLQSKSFREVEGPEGTLTSNNENGTQHRRFFAFTNKVFCLFSQEEKKIGQDKFDHREWEYSYSWGFYTLRDSSWNKLCDIPLDERPGRCKVHENCFFKVHIIRDEIYVLVMNRKTRKLESDTLYKVEEYEGSYIFQQIKLETHVHISNTHDAEMCTDIHDNLIIHYLSQFGDKVSHFVLDRRLNEMVCLDNLIQAPDLSEQELGEQRNCVMTHKWRYVNIKHLYMIVYPQGLDARLCCHENSVNPNTGNIMGWRELPGPPSSKRSRLLVTQIPLHMLSGFNKPAQRMVFTKKLDQTRSSYTRKLPRGSDATDDSSAPEEDESVGCNCHRCRDSDDDVEDSDDPYSWY